MAKRYYNLEKETRAFLKRMEETRGTLPDGSGIQRVNDYIVKRKGLGRIFSSIYRVSQNFNTIGTADRLAVASNSTLQVKPTWEMAAWVFPKRTEGTQEQIAKATNSAAGFEFSLRYTGSYTLQAATGTSYVATPGISVPINTWNFMRFGRDASTNNIFLSRNNLTPVTAVQLTQAVQNAAFTMGNWNDNVPGRSGDVNIDSVGRWDRLLTTDERAFLFNSGNGVSFFEILAYQPSLLISLISYWQLSESSGIRYDWWGDNHMIPNFTLTTSKGLIEKFF